MKDVFSKYKLISDSSEFLHDTQLEVYQKLREELQKDFPAYYPIFVSGIVKQYKKEYGESYEGYELFGGGVSQIGNEFSLHDLAIVDIVLAPTLQKYITEKGGEAWLWIKTNILQPLVSLGNPAFSKRASVPVILNRMKKGNDKSIVVEAKNELKKLIRIKEGIPSFTEVIFDQLRRNLDDYEQDILLNLIKTDIARSGVPSNIFIVILLFELMRRKNEDAKKIFLKLLDNDKYFEYDDFYYHTLDHFHIIAEEAELQEAILLKFLANKTWMKKADKIVHIGDLYGAFRSFAVAKARETAGRLEFLDSFLGEKLDDLGLDLVFRCLRNVATEFPNQVFAFVKTHLGKVRKAHEFIKDDYTRQEIVEVGYVFTEKQMFDEALWIVKKFINDPDPRIDEDSEFNYHKKIERGEDPGIVTSVRGRVAWVLQKLAFDKRFIQKAFICAKELLNTDNLYVIQQGMVPLTEITARRERLKKIDARYEQELHDLLFELLDNYSKYPPIGEYLLHAFSYYRELNEHEAKKVLESLEHIDESAALFIYFAIYRKKHFKEKGEFDSSEFEEILREKIKSGSENLRRKLAWHLWKILNEKRDEFETLRPYIDLFLQQPYSRDLYNDIERIIRDWIKANPEVCIRWFKLMLDQISRLVDSEKQNVWLRSTEEVIEAVAEHKPNELLEVMEKLLHLWTKGVFIGSHKRLFETFRLVLDEKQKEEIKRKFQEWHVSMKSLNPKLEPVDFT
jgi:hypothetical protein